MYLSKEQILAAQDVRFEDVETTLWGGKVRIRSMTGADRDAYEQWLMDNRTADDKANLRQLRARLCCLSIVDADGQRIFEDTDIEALSNKSAVVLENLADAIIRLNVLSRDGLEDMLKNSEPGRSASTA